MECTFNITQLITCVLCRHEELLESLWKKLIIKMVFFMPLNQMAALYLQKLFQHNEWWFLSAAHFQQSHYLEYCLRDFRYIPLILFLLLLNVFIVNHTVTICRFNSFITLKYLTEVERTYAADEGAIKSNCLLLGASHAYAGNWRQCGRQQWTTMACWQWGSQQSWLVEWMLRGIVIEVRKQIKCWVVWYLNEPKQFGHIF